MVIPTSLKEAVIWPLLKKTNPGLRGLFQLLPNYPLLGKVIEMVVGIQLQMLLDEADYLDPFQLWAQTRISLCIPDRGPPSREEQGCVTLMILLNLLVASDVIDHCNILDCLYESAAEGTVLWCFHFCLQGRFQKVALGECALTLC